MEAFEAGTVQSGPALRRVIGVGGLTFLALNQMIGSGIAGLPGLVAGLVGPSALLPYAIAAVLMGLVGLCFAEVGRRVSAPGGITGTRRSGTGVPRGPTKRRHSLRRRSACG
jgi:amino acid transporter